MVIYSCLWICNTAEDWAGESLIIRPDSLHIIATSASAGGSRKKNKLLKPNPIVSMSRYDRYTLTSAGTGRRYNLPPYNSRLVWIKYIFYFIILIALNSVETWAEAVC